MSRFHRLPILIACVLGSLALCASAQAAPVTIGSTATTGVISAPSTPTGLDTVIDVSVSGAGATVISPISGTIVSWHLTGFVGGPFYLRVLTPNGGATYTGTGKSAGVIPSGVPTQTFTTSLPIKAGQTIGVDNSSPSDLYGAITSPTGFYSYFNPGQAPEGSAGTANGPNPGAEFTFNAQVQPPPTITAISPTSGSFKGGTKVKITGTDFEGTSAVSFGGIAAKGFTVESETQITAVAPPTPKPQSLPVAVTTIAGAATSSTSFTGTACVVPKLIGKKLKAAKKKLKKAGCKLGKVKLLGEATTKTGEVKKQNPKPGKTLAPGSKVSVKLE